MKFSLQFPIDQAGFSPRFLEPDGLVEFVSVAEAAGFDGVGFSEHPAPSAKWLRQGGHPTLDPIAALSFAAAHTSHIQLISHLLVLPYQNPIRAAKALSTVQLLSAGRLIVGVGAGYLRSEFQALGVEYSERGALLDEALEVLRIAWSGEPFTYVGRNFEARDQILTPIASQGAPPVWIGGNSRHAIERVARCAQGWAPIYGSDVAGQGGGADSLSSVDELASATSYLRERLAKHDRAHEEVDVHVRVHGEPALATGNLDQHRDHLGELSDAGATWSMVILDAKGYDEMLESVRQYGEGIIDLGRAA